MAIRDAVIRYTLELRDLLSGKIKQINEAVRGQQTQSDKTTAAIERNNQRQAASYTAASKAVSGLRTALAAVGIAVGLNEAKDLLLDVLETGERFDDLGKKFTTAFGSLEQGAVALGRVRDIAAGTPFAFEEVAEAAVELKRRGFDPLDGSLQALLDNTAANDDSMADLMATIEALGKASIKGEIGMRALVSLTERGIPVFQILGTAMGKSEDEIRSMAEAGELGAGSIKALVQGLGELRAGASTEELGDLDAQLQKLRDIAASFLNEIAKAGVLDVFKGKLEELKNTLVEMERDGSLKEMAEDISTTFSVTATALSGVAKAVSGVFSTLKVLAHGAVTFISGALSGILKASEVTVIGLGKLGLATKETEQRFAHLAKVAELLRRESMKNLSDAAVDLGEKVGVVSEKVEESAGKFENLAPKFDAVTGSMQGLGNELKLVPDYLNEAVTGSERFAEEMARAEASVAAATAKLQAARDAVVGLSKANVTSNEAWRAAEADIKNASKELEEARKKVADLSGETAKTEAATKALGKAFKDLRITSQAELDAAAVAAEQAFELIVQAAYKGQAAQEDVIRAFKAYAAAERARVADSTEASRQQVENHIRIAASAAGLLDVYEAMAVKGKAAGTETAAGFEQAKAKIDAAAESAKGLGNAADDAASGLNTVADSANRAATTVNNTGYALGFMSERAAEAIAQARGFDQIRGVMMRYKDEIFATREELDAFTASQRAAGEAAEQAASQLEALTEQLQQQRDEATLSADDLERKRYETQLEQIRQLEDASNGSASSVAARARGLAEQEHRRRLEEIEAEARARRESESGQTSSNSSSSPGPRPSGGGQSTGGFGGGPSQAPPQNPAAGQFSGPPINVHVSVGNVASPAQMDAFARDLKRRLDKIARLSA